MTWTRFWKGGKHQMSLTVMRRTYDTVLGANLTISNIHFHNG